MYDEQVRTNKTKELTISGTKLFGDELRQVRQQNDIAVIVAPHERRHYIFIRF